MTLPIKPVQPPVEADLDRALIAEIAKDIGASTVSHLRIMYPEAFAALPESGRISLRNHVRNQIMAALDTTDVDEVRARLDRRKMERRAMHKAYDDLRKGKP